MMGAELGVRSTARNHKTTGFTLIEIMVVMLLISIILAVAVPRFDSGILQNSRKTITRRMIHTIQALRSKAIGQQITCALIIDISNDRYWTVDDTMDELTMAQATEKASKLPGDIHFIAAAFPNQEMIRSGNVEIQFHPKGYADHALIHLQSDDEQRFSFIIEPLLPKVKVMDKWPSF